MSMNPDDAASLIAQAQALEARSPHRALELYLAARALAPHSLEVHNAMERLRAPERYSQWMHVNCVIDPRDEIYRFFATHPLAANPIREYLADGWRTLAELMAILESVDRPLTRSRSVLEFASGFGRFTRHLARLLPDRVTCSDVQAGAMEFAREQFGVKAFDSATQPESLRIPGEYDLVFVLSMFTMARDALRGGRPGGSARLQRAQRGPWARERHLVRR